MNGPAPIHFAAYAAHPHHQGEVDYHDFHRSLIAELRTAVPYKTMVPVNL